MNFICQWNLLCLLIGYIRHKTTLSSNELKVYGYIFSSAEVESKCAYHYEKLKDV